MKKFVTVAKLSEVPAGQGRAVTVGETEVAVFNVNGSIYAINNVCVHRGGPLAEGLLEGHMVTCPWHAWTYDVRTGACTLAPSAQVESYPTRVEDGEIQVQV